MHRQMICYMYWRMDRRYKALFAIKVFGYYGFKIPWSTLVCDNNTMFWKTLVQTAVLILKKQCKFGYTDVF